MTSILSDSTNSQQQQEMDYMIRTAYALLLQNNSYKKCIKEFPKCWRAYQNLGVAYIMVRDYESAIQVLRSYVQHVPKDHLGHDSLGVSYSQSNNHLQAICSFVNSINTLPTYFMSYYNLGVVLSKLGLYQHALDIYNKCLQFHPNYANAMNNIADIYKRLGNIDRAIQIFTSVTQLDPLYSLGLMNLANCYFSKQQYFQALVTYLKYLDGNLATDSILLNVGFCLDRFQLFAEAANCIMKAYHMSQGQDQTQSLVKLFKSGNLFCRQLNLLTRQMTICSKFRQNTKKQLKQRFYNTYLCAIQSYERVCKLTNTQSQGNRVNSYKVKLSTIAYKAERGGPPSSKEDKGYDDLLQFPLAVTMLQELRKQKRLFKKVVNWNKYLKRLVKHQKKRLNSKKLKFLNQKQKVFQMLNKQNYQPKRLEFKVNSYISRTNSHNLKRLILRRCKFIKSYHKFDSEFERIHKLQTSSFDPDPRNQDIRN